MKKLFLALLLILPFLNSYAQDKDEHDFGVIVFYRLKDKAADYPLSISINNISVGLLKGNSKLTHKIFSEGSLLLNIEYLNGMYSKQINLDIKNSDTIYLQEVFKRGGTRMVIEINTRTKAEYLSDISKITFENDINTKERLDFPYNSISKSKLSKGVERSGTGFLVSEQGYILTNFHVIDGTKEILIKGVNGNPKSSLSASVVLKDEANDLALLKLDDRVLLDSIKYSIKKEQADVGQSIYVLGYPMPSSMGSEIKLTNGLVSSKSGYEGNINSYQVSAAVQGGNSGGPVFDDKGNIIAIVNAKHLDAENVTYAIKTKYFFDLIESSDSKINIHSTSSISNKNLQEQTKEISKFVYMIIAK